MTSSRLVVRTTTVGETLASLRRAGERGSEGVVLWLGYREPDRIVVTTTYVPEQEAASDFFRIRPQAMAALLTYLGESGTFIAAQVHSHPRDAFHSVADDKWAIVRHAGALSLVVPYFARNTSTGNFLDQTAAFRLSALNVWQELQPADRRRSIEIV